MIEYLVIGSGFAFTAAIQPGPLQAFLLSSVAKRGWVRTLPACLAPLLSDGPIVLLVLLVLNRVPVTVNRFLQAAGGVLLLYLAWGSYRAWRQHDGSSQAHDGSAPSTLLQAAAVNVLNPNPYLAWSLVLGPTLLEAWHQSPAHGMVFMLAFYGTMVTVLAGTIVLMGTTRFLGPRGRRTLVLVSAVMLAVLGAYQITAGLLGIGGADHLLARAWRCLGCRSGHLEDGAGADITQGRATVVGGIRGWLRAMSDLRSYVAGLYWETLRQSGQFEAVTIARTPIHCNRGEGCLLMRNRGEGLQLAVGSAIAGVILLLILILMGYTPGPVTIDLGPISVGMTAPGTEQEKAPSNCFCVLPVGICRRSQ